jgi:hypothetical protein
LLPALAPTSLQWVGPVPDAVKTVAMASGQPLFFGASSSVRRVLKPHMKVRMRPSIREDDRRRMAVTAWKDTLLSDFPMASTSVQMLEAADDQMRMQIMRHSVFKKSTNTLCTRLSGLRRVKSWLDKHDRLTLSEPSLYKFAAAVHTHATSVASAISALNFVGGTFGCSDLFAITQSRRVAGASAESLAQLPAIKQSLALKPHALCKFEYAVHDEGCATELRILSGGFLLCVALRSRYSDASKIVSVSFDDELIQATPSSTKTSKLDASRKDLTMLGPRRLFTGLDWFGKWLSMRQSLGIPFPAWPVVPSCTGNVYGQTAACVGDVNAALKELGKTLCIEGADQLSSHSGKASMLAFAGSSGLSVACRAALGYHRMPGETSAIRAYDREHLMTPVCALLREVDKYAGGAGLRADGCLSAVDANVAVVDDDSEGAQSIADVLSDSSSSGSCSSEDEEVALGPKRDSRKILNTKTGTVHAGRFGSDSESYCGRAYLAHYKLVSDDQVPYEAYQCDTCFPGSQEKA